MTQLVTELDALEDEEAQVMVLGATNYLEKLDSRLIRPGRLDRLIHVPLPSPQDRVDILQKCIRRNKIPIDSSVDLKDVADRMQGKTGADLNEVLRRAMHRAVTRFEEGGGNCVIVTSEDISF